MKRFNLNGHMALIELSSTGIPIAGVWTGSEEELTDDELLLFAETYADDCREHANDCRDEEAWERDNDK